GRRRRALPRRSHRQLRHRSAARRRRWQLASRRPRMASVALITGAASGIGAACTARFVAGGGHVAAVDIDPVAAADHIHPIRADLSEVAECRRAVADAAEWIGRLDAVVNAAGLWTEGPSADTTEADWDRVIDVNLKGLYFVCAAAIPHLTVTQGCIV